MMSLKRYGCDIQTPVQVPEPNLSQTKTWIRLLKGGSDKADEAAEVKGARCAAISVIMKAEINHLVANKGCLS